MNPQPGEIWLADLGLSAKTRPVNAIFALKGGDNYEIYDDR